MKRIILLVLSLVVMATLLAACTPSNTTVGNQDKVSVVATIFPPYDFVREIAGDKVELTMLLPPGAESHSFEPTPQDIIKIQNCDMFIYVGGDSDTWIDGILDSMDTSNIKIVSLMDLVDTVEEEIVEGMEDSHGHDHGHGDAIHKEDIEARPLADFAGDWQSVLPYFADGTLDEYIAASAEKNETTAAEEKAAFLEKRATEYKSIDITDDKLTVYTDTASMTGNYSYVEYRPVYNDENEITNVWYIYQITKIVENMPTYLAFNDHKIKSIPDEDHEGHEDHDVHEEELAHFHMRYGSESIEALIEVKNWAPTYYPADAAAEAIKDALASHDHSHDGEYDEHVWTSPQNAIKIVAALSEQLCAIDTAHAAEYKQNTTAYLEKLKELDKAFRQAVVEGNRKTLVFGDRFPFRYLVDTYGLDYFAAFPGCSTETEPSAATVAFLIDKVKEENIPVIFHIELSNEKMADTICEATGAVKQLLHSCHNITKSEFEKGVSYLDLMTKNVESLKEALK